MNNREIDSEEEKGTSLTLPDIYYILFRQKWLILLSLLVGLAGAVTLFLKKPPLFQSETKLYIRYVAGSESFNPSGPEDAQRLVRPPVQSLINTELEILGSFDLARKVAETVGPEKILAKVGGGTNLDHAAAVILRNLFLPSEKGSSVIPIIFQHPDSDVAGEVLTNVVLVYFEKHAQTHQPLRVVGSFLTQETARLIEELARTEQQLVEMKRQAQVASVDDARKSLTEQLSRIRMDLFDAEAELAGYQTVLEQTTNNISQLRSDGGTNPIVAQVPPDTIEEYNRIRERLAGFRKREDEHRYTYTSNSVMLMDIRQQIASIEAEKKNLESLFPQLPFIIAAPGLPGLPVQPAASSMALPVEATRVEFLKSRIDNLKARYAQVQAEATKLDELSVPIANLQRKRDVLDSKVKYFSDRLEEANIDEALGTGKPANIGMIDPPTPPFKARPKSFRKKLGIVGLGPIFAGLGLAFLIEMFLDNSVRRPVDVQRKLRLPLFISIPRLKSSGRRKLPADGVSSSTAVSVLDRSDHPLRRFYEGLRDRLIVYFEVRNLTHKPKLVAVTSCDRGAGVSGVAAGLAAALSETGDGHVLLVDMNPDKQGASQEFHKGNLCSGLEPAVDPDTKNGALVHENLYVAAEHVSNEKLPRVLSNRFKQLMPKLRASDYDYIIFDMPPVSPTTITPRMAGVMDMVLMVVESEKTTVGVTKQAMELLSESNATVSVVLNKTRAYVPARLHQELNCI